jgi:hypothetical protein
MVLLLQEPGADVTFCPLVKGAEFVDGENLLIPPHA